MPSQCCGSHATVTHHADGTIRHTCRRCGLYCNYSVTATATRVSECCDASVYINEGGSTRYFICGNCSAACDTKVSVS